MTPRQLRKRTAPTGELRLCITAERAAGAAPPDGRTDTDTHKEHTHATEKTLAT